MLTVVNEPQNFRLATGTIKAFNTQFIHRCSNPRCKAAGQRLGQYSVKVSVNSGRQSGLLQGQDHEIRSRDYHSSVRETTVCWALRLYKCQPGWPAAVSCDHRCRGRTDEDGIAVGTVATAVLFWWCSRWLLVKWKSDLRHFMLELAQKIGRFGGVLLDNCQIKDVQINCFCLKYLL